MNNAAESMEFREHWSLLDAANKVRATHGERWASVLNHGNVRLSLYAPDRHDHQKPHEQDEVYIVAQGSGIFINGGRRHSFRPGDAMFVRAGVEHQFKNFTHDLLVWVILCKPSENESSA